MTGTTTVTTSGAPLPVLREIPGGKLKRDLSFVSGTIDLEARTVVFSASSEYPVARWFGMEVLDHAEGSVDLTRMRNGAPYLLQHNAWSGQIGVVLEAWLEDRRLHVKVKLSRNEQAEAIWQDLIDGIRQNVSIGYIPLEMVLERTEGNQEFYRVTRWEPFEVSSVSVPADPTVGLGRSHEATTNTIIVRGNTMTGTNT
ncbi:MAG: HK97 family phage prohead protease, partial [Specibacter sp.]